MEKYDVVISGCGPSGTTAACILASAGMRVALIDRSAFPRDKLCGGLLSHRAKQVFDEVFRAPWEDVIEHETRDVEFHYSGRLLNRARSPYPLYLTSRRSFDACLLDHARARGANAFEGTVVSSVDTEHSEVSTACRRLFRADFIIGADGVTSRVRNALATGPFRKSEHALCFQTDIRREDMPDQGVPAEVHFGYARWGYGWVFPKKETYSIGIGALMGCNSDLKSLFKDFFTHRIGRHPEKVKGHYVPYGNYMHRPGLKNILLAGDAAGFVEPITGEGISWAMLSGKYAAEAILQAANRGDPGHAAIFYQKKCRELMNIIRSSKLLRSLIFSRFAEPFSMKAISGSSAPLEDFLCVVAGTMSYGRFVRSATIWSARSVAKRAFGI